MGRGLDENKWLRGGVWQVSKNASCLLVILGNIAYYLVFIHTNREGTRAAGGVSLDNSHGDGHGQCRGLWNHADER